MLSGLVNRLLSLVHYHGRRNKPLVYKFMKTYFLDYGGLKWKVSYMLNFDDSEEKKIELIPYCRKCKRQYEQKQSINNELASFHCPVCKENKKGYPLMTNYRAVVNLVETQVNEMREQFGINDTSDERV
jgi:hypothetical protein